MLETAAAFIAVAVTHAHLVFETRLGLGNGRRREAHRKVVAATGIVKAEREGYVRLTEVRSDGQRAVGRGKDLHLGLQRRGGIRASDVDAEQTAGRDAVVADAVALEIVGHAQRIAVYAGVHLIVARDRDVERMGRITPYVEVRRTVLTQVNAVVEDAAAPCGADHQVRSARRGVVGVFVLLVRNRGYRALRVLEEVLHARTAAPRGVGKLHERSIGEILLRGRRGTRRREERRTSGDGTQAYGAQFEVGDLIRHADVVGDLGHGTPHAQWR